MFNGIVQFPKESFYRNKLCKNKDKQPVLYCPGVAHMLASRVPYKDPVRICSKWSLVEKPKDVLSSPSSFCCPCLGPRSWVGFLSIFFSIWGKVVSSFKHFTLMEECQTIMSSHLLALSFLLVLINPRPSWLTSIWSWSWMNKFLWNAHMQGSVLRFTRIKQMFWIEVLFWDLYTLICHQNHTRINP